MLARASPNTFDGSDANPVMIEGSSHLQTDASMDEQQMNLKGRGRNACVYFAAASVSDRDERDPDMWSDLETVLPSEQPVSIHRGGTAGFFG